MHQHFGLHRHYWMHNAKLDACKFTFLVLNRASSIFKISHPQSLTTQNINLDFWLVSPLSGTFIPDWAIKPLVNDQTIAESLDCLCISLSAKTTSPCGQEHQWTPLYTNSLRTRATYSPFRILMILHIRKTTSTVLPTSWEKLTSVTATSKEKDMIMMIPSMTC